MKENLKKSWTNNLGMKLLSVPLAFLIWIIIINVDDPTISRNFPNVAIELQNVDALDSLGKVYEIPEGNAATITVTGRRSIVDKIKSSDLKVTADLKQLTAFNKLDVEVSCEKYSYWDLSFSAKPKMLTVSLEDKLTKQFKVNIETKGSVDDSFYVGSLEANPKMIEVSGAESIVESIADVRVVVQLNDETADFKQTELVPRAYDASGKEIDSSKLEFSHSTISVKVSVQDTKVVPIKVTTVGTPLSGYGMVQMDFDPSQIKITGTKEALSRIEAIPVQVDITNARSTIEKEIILTEYLPAGVTIVGTTNSIAVKVTIEPLGTKKISFTISDIEILNIPEGMELTYVESDHAYEVTILGLKEALELVTAERLGAYIDLSGLSEGNHAVTIKFGENTEYTIASSPTITITLSSEVDDVEEDDPQEPSDIEDEPEDDTDVDEENPPEEIEEE